MIENNAHKVCWGPPVLSPVDSAPQVIVDSMGLHLFRKKIQIEGCAALNNLARDPANVVSVYD